MSLPPSIPLCIHAASSKVYSLGGGTRAGIYPFMNYSTGFIVVPIIAMEGKAKKNQI